MPTLRIGLIGAGANTRSRHIPGLREQPGVEIVAVCNRRPASTAAVAREFGIPRTHEHWQELVADRELHAIVIGTWPYLHAPITLAALEAGKHVLTEARMCLNATEAHQMLTAAQRHPDLITQIVPSPYGLRGRTTVKELLEGGYLGELREYHVSALVGSLAAPEAPLSWRQDEALSGLNMLMLGIVHETMSRWLPQPVRVLAQAHAFIPTRLDPESGVRRPVGTPDSVQALTVLENHVRGVYQCSGVTPVGGGMLVRFYGSRGVLHYDLAADKLFGSQGGELAELPLPSGPEHGWRVEADFVQSIREGRPVTLTDFATGVAYMEFTEAVARGARFGGVIELPLDDLAG